VCGRGGGGKQGGGFYAPLSADMRCGSKWGSFKGGEKRQEGVEAARGKKPIYGRARDRKFSRQKKRGKGGRWEGRLLETGVLLRGSATFSNLRENWRKHLYLEMLKTAETRGDARNLPALGETFK